MSQQKEQEFVLKLSGVDLEMLYKTAGRVNLKPEELLENFIQDLVGSTYSNGSDECMLAEEWFDRCWFSMFPEETFLKYVLEEEDIGHMVETLKDLEVTKKEFSTIYKQLETGKIESRRGTCTWEDLSFSDGTPCYTNQEEWEKGLREDLECCQAILTLHERELDEVWNRFQKNKSSNFNKEEEMEKVKNWAAEMEQRIKGKGDVPVPETTEEEEKIPIKI